MFTNHRFSIIKWSH